MKQSKRSNEGYLLIDNSFAVRNSPNPYPSEADMAHARASGHDFPGMTVPVFESATFTCHHCQAVVVLNPDRSRAREYCSWCDHYICDACGFMKKHGAPCLPMAKKLDAIQREAERELILRQIV